MLELVKKDFRMCRLLLFAFGTVIFLPYLAFGAYLLYESNSAEQVGRQVWGDRLTTAIVFSRILTVFSFPFLGGYIVAGERRERSAEFLAYLPPKPSTILFSKFLICLGWTIFALVFQLLMSLWLVPYLIETSITETSWETRLNAWAALASMFTVFASMFGVAWMLSCMTRSPVSCVVGGIITPAVVLLVALAISYLWNKQIDDFMTPTTTFSTFASIAVGSFAIGCLHYIRRVEP